MTPNTHLATVVTYFRMVDARDPRLPDLFTDDVEVFFPKHGTTRGKAALARLSAALGRDLERLDHDIDGFRYLVDGDRVVVEGTERGVSRGGRVWPDGEISQGRFCDVFDFRGGLISRLYIYVDPDFTNEHGERLRELRGEPAGAAGAPGGDVRELTLRYFELMRAGAAPEAVAALFSDEADWEIAGDVAAVPWIGKRRGRAAVAEFVRRLRRDVESLRFAVERLVVDGERALALGTLASRVKATGRVIESEFAFDITARDGHIVRYRMFEDSFAVAEAVRAV